MTMTINQHIKQLRQAHGWRQKELADKLGVAVITVKKWEQGLSVPDSPNRKKLAAIFRTTEGGLFNGEGAQSHQQVPEELSMLSKEEVGVLQAVMKLLRTRSHPSEETHKLKIENPTRIHHHNGHTVKKNA